MISRLNVLILMFFFSFACGLPRATAYETYGMRVSKEGKIRTLLIEKYHFTEVQALNVSLVISPLNLDELYRVLSSIEYPKDISNLKLIRVVRRSSPNRTGTIKVSFTNGSETQSIIFSDQVDPIVFLEFFSREPHLEPVFRNHPSTISHLEYQDWVKVTFVDYPLYPTISVATPESSFCPISGPSVLTNEAQGPLDSVLDASVGEFLFPDEENIRFLNAWKSIRDSNLNRPIEFPEAPPTVATPATSKAEFCASLKSDPHFSQRLLFFTENQLAFENQGGIHLPGVGDGTCYWHSRFTRNANYLTLYSPSKPQPTEGVAKQIIKKIVSGDEIVEIPGYKNLREFSQVFKDQIQDALNAWQLSSLDMLVHSLSGSTELSPDELRKQMDALYTAVHDRHDVVFQTWQKPGLASHAWLVIGAARTEHGMDLSVVDSNWQGAYGATYTVGDTHIEFSDKTFVPMTAAEDEFTQLLEVQNDYCQ